MSKDKISMGMYKVQRQDKVDGLIQKIQRNLSSLLQKVRSVTCEPFIIVCFFSIQWRATTYIISYRATNFST